MAELTGMSPTHNPTQTPATGAGTVAQAGRIAWHRARSFNFLQPGPPTRIGALVAPWLWPIELFGIARESPRIRRLGGASMTLTGAVRGHADPTILLAAAVAYLLFMVMLVVAGGTAAIALVRASAMGIGPATAVSLGTLLAPLLIEVTRRVVNVMRHPENRTILRRRRQLAQITGRPVVIMTAFVRAHPGEGAALLDAMRREWDQNQVTVILNPANKELVRYYQRHGATPDASTWRRLSIAPDQQRPVGDRSSAPAARNPAI